MTALVEWLAYLFDRAVYAVFMWFAGSPDQSWSEAL